MWPNGKNPRLTAILDPALPRRCFSRTKYHMRKQPWRWLVLILILIPIIKIMMIMIIKACRDYPTVEKDRSRFKV